MTCDRCGAEITGTVYEWDGKKYCSAECKVLASLGE